VRLPGALPAAEQGLRAPHRVQRELGPRRRHLAHAPPPGARPEPQTSRVQISEKGAEISLIPAPPFRIASDSPDDASAHEEMRKSVKSRRSVWTPRPHVINMSKRMTCRGFGFMILAPRLDARAGRNFTLESAARVWLTGSSVTSSDGGNGNRRGQGD